MRQRDTLVEAARWARQQEARRALIERLGGPTLTAEEALAIGEEQAGGRQFQPKSRRRKAP
ncbi:MAG: hypothetical protein IPJ34_02785 [Myxococcales bacterium]|nr:hypothetical protein [Myxococcales bacterium]